MGHRRNERARNRASAESSNTEVTEITSFFSFGPTPECTSAKCTYALLFRWPARRGRTLRGKHANVATLTDLRSTRSSRKQSGGWRKSGQAPMSFSCHTSLTHETGMPTLLGAAREGGLTGE